MCLQDLRIAKHINTRTIKGDSFDGSFLRINPSQNRYGLCVTTLGTSYLVTRNDAGNTVQIPYHSFTASAGNVNLFTDLSIFPGLNQTTVYLANPDGGANAVILEQYFDSTLSKLIQGDV